MDNISIVITIALSLFYVYILQRFSETAEETAPKLYALALGIPMTVFMLYALHVLPAVPLSLNEGIVAHSVIKGENGEFAIQKETDKRVLAKYRIPLYYLTSLDTGIYFYSSVDAPAELAAPLSHVWEYYDETQRRWVVKEVIPFGIVGGRNGGYRAYSYKENISLGLWRVTVMVDENRIVGRMKFKVVN